MLRRDFIRVLAGLAAAWPFAGQAQAQQGLPVVAFVRSTTSTGAADLEAAFREGLKGGGFVDGKNVSVEYHFADDRADRLSALIVELIRRPVAVIVGNTIAALAAKAATTTVPVVFVTGTDPVKSGLVTRLDRPGGNMTGVSFLVAAVGTKRLDLLRQIVPKPKPTIAVFVHRNSPQAKLERVDLPAAAKALGLRLLVLDIANDKDIETAIASAVKGGADAVFVGAGAFLNSHRGQLLTLATHHVLPTSFIVRAPVVAGGLMSYGPSQNNAYRQAGSYVAMILNGKKPADLPVAQSTRFEFVLNLKTAKALGLNIPPALLAVADEVIE